jgi:hypothetical protein
MRASHFITPLTLLLSLASANKFPSNDRDAISDTTLTFYRSLDKKNETLFRSVATNNLVFDGTLFATIGVGAPEPLVGLDIIAPSLIAALNMTTMHNVGNFVVDVGAQHANVSAYVLAYHYKQLEEPRENPRNRYLMGNEFKGGLVREKGNGKWRFEWVKVFPFFQDGNIAVMGLPAGGE